MFDQKQIQEFKEAFNMIDQNKNQIIDKEDLADIYASLGKDHGDDYLQEMLDDAPGPINFTGRVGIFFFFDFFIFFFEKIEIMTILTPSPS